MGTILDLKNIPVPNATGAHIIGKGPSLDTLTAADFPDPTWPVLAVNESIHAIEKLNLPNPVFGITQDARVAMASKPARSSWLLSKQAWKKGKGDDTPNTYQYTPALFKGCKTSTLTACMALEIIHLTTIKQVWMHAFDAHFGNEMRYATCIGYDYMKWNKDKTRFKRYSNTIQGTANKHGIQLKWVPPPPAWQVAVMVPVITNCAARHVRAYLAKAKENIPGASFVVFSNLPGADFQLKDLQTTPPLASLFRSGMFVEGFPVLYLPVTSLPVSRITLPRPESIEAGLLYTSAAVGNQAGALIWKAGTLTSVYDKSIQNKGYSETALLASCKTADINTLLHVCKWPDAKGADILQFAGDRRPWSDDVKILKVSEY